MPKSEFQSTLLDSRLQDLPRNIAPERDLWPSIERNIQRSQRRLLTVAIAAGVAVISIALVLNFSLQPATEENLAVIPSTGKSLDWMRQTADLQQMKAGLHRSEPTVSAIGSGNTWCSDGESCHHRTGTDQDCICLADASTERSAQ